MGYNLFTLGLFLLAAHMAAGVPADCGEIYQNTLQSLLLQKEKCDIAGFKDCCQVNRYYYIKSTIQKKKILNLRQG